MIYFFQSLSLKMRFLRVLVLFFPVLVFQWLYSGAPWALAHLKLIAHGAGVADSGFWYQPDQLKALFEAWGAEGKNLYITVLWPTDLGFLLSYGLFLTAATLFLLKKANPAASWWYFLPLIPLAAAAFDLLENLAVGLAVLLPAEGWEPVSWAAATFTASKWVAVGCSLAVLTAGLAGTLVRLGWGKLRTQLRADDRPPNRDS